MTKADITDEGGLLYISDLTVFKPSRGFTIVELLVVIAVIGILAAITVVAYTGVSQRAIAASLQSDLSNASTQLKMFYTTNGAYPTTNDCSATPALNSICLKASNGNSFSYSSNNTTNPPTFSLTETNSNGAVYNITDSTAVAVGSLATVSAVPTSLSATGGSNQVTLNWVAPASNGGSSITNYKVYRGTTSGGETLLTTLGNVLTYIDTSLTGGTTYYYKVTAVNGVGESSNSNETSYSQVILYYYNKYNVSDTTTYSNPTSFSFYRTEVDAPNMYNYLNTAYSFLSGTIVGFYATGSTVNFPTYVGQVVYAPSSGSCWRYTATSFTSPNYQVTMDAASATPTVNHAQGSLATANIVAGNGTYPDNGYYSTDGYWYVKGTRVN